MKTEIKFGFKDGRYYYGVGKKEFITFWDIFPEFGHAYEKEGKLFIELRYGHSRKVVCLGRNILPDRWKDVPYNEDFNLEIEELIENLIEKYKEFRKEVMELSFEKVFKIDI